MLRMTKPRPSGPATMDAVHALHLDWDGGCQRYPRPAPVRQVATPLDPQVLMASAPEALHMSSSQSSTNSFGGSSSHTPSPPTSPERGEMPSHPQMQQLPSPEQKRLPRLPPTSENVTFAPPPQMDRSKPPHPCEVEGHTVGRAGLLQRMGKSPKCSRCGITMAEKKAPSSSGGKRSASDGRRVPIRMLGLQDGAAQQPPPPRK